MQPSDAPAKRKDRKSDKDLLTRIRERYRQMTEADQENRRCAMEDMKFLNLPGAQWDENMKKERGDRPCYEFNKIRITCKRVINDMRANRPAGKVRAVEDGDKDTADTYEGLIRNIANVSDMETITDRAAEYQVGAGYAAWRITSEYAEEDAFEQDVLIKPFPNPFCVYADNNAKDELGRDADDWIVTERMSVRAFEKRWPDAEKSGFDDLEFDDDGDWQDEDSIRVVEYWYREPYQKRLWQLQDGRVIDADDPASAELAPLVKRERASICHRVKMCIASAGTILEKQDWAGRFFPFVRVYGEYCVIDGRVHWWGLVRHSKDAQRSYNIGRTAIDEKVAMTPQAKFWATAAQAKGNEAKWREAHQKNFPFLIYNPDPLANSGGAPQTMVFNDIPAALVQQVQLASEEIKSVTGIFDPSLGAQSNETSGRAIQARQQQGEIATFNYRDNMGKAWQRTYEILIDLIPKFYDTERQLRILGADGAEKYVKVNQVVQDPATLERRTVNDLARGKYDVTVTVGPSWATKRMEAAEAYGQLSQQDPLLMATAGDLVYKSLDLPYAEEIAERRRAMLPPQIQQMLTKDKPVPPEVQAVLTQAEQVMQVAQQQSQLVQAAAQEVEQEKAVAEKAKAEVQTLIEKLKTEQERFKAFVAQQEARIAQAEAQLAQKGAQDGVAGDREALSTEISQAVAAIQQMAAQFMQQAADTLAQIMAKQQTQVLVPPRPKLRSLRAMRQNGQLLAVPEYEDDAQVVQ